MSAQIITALRLRAGVLDTEARNLVEASSGKLAASVAPDLLRVMVKQQVAQEFRALADMAESL